MPCCIRGTGTCAHLKRLLVMQQHVCNHHHMQYVYPLCMYFVYGVWCIYEKHDVCFCSCLLAVVFGRRTCFYGCYLWGSRVCFYSRLARIVGYNEYSTWSHGSFDHHLAGPRSQWYCFFHKLMQWFGQMSLVVANFGLIQNSSHHHICWPFNNEGWVRVHGLNVWSTSQIWMDL